MIRHGSYNDNDIRYSCSRDEKPDRAAFRMHSHEFCELYCFLSGGGVFRIEGNEYPLEPWDILVMRPNEAHYIEPDEFQPYERLSVHFRKSMLDRIDPDGALTTAFFDRAPGQRNLFRREDFQDGGYRMFIEMLTQPAPNRRAQILSGLVPLLNDLSGAMARRGGGHVQADTQMSRIVRYINRNLSEQLTLDMLCEQFFISKPQLCRAFKRATGATVGEYIAVKRMLSARELLRSGVPPTKVCGDVGCGDYSTFYRAYRKYFGVNPQSDFRA